MKIQILILIITAVALAFGASPAEVRRVRISSFSTSFHLGELGRSHNIRLAASLLDGKEIKAGQTFSFNQTLGERTPEAGYWKAPYLEGGEKVEVNGGGICLVSSVLYNAALLGGLEVVERHPHSRLVPYLPAGQDATVAYGIKDLRFRNPYSETLKIETAVEGSRLIINLTASQPLFAYHIRILPKGSEQPDGSIRVTTFREWELQSHLLKRELLSEDTYPVSGQPPSGATQLGVAPVLFPGGQR